jgi:hypothetical protein
VIGNLVLPGGCDYSLASQFYVVVGQWTIPMGLVIHVNLHFGMLQLVTQVN